MLLHLFIQHHVGAFQVSSAMGEEIFRLHVIVDEFHGDFHPSAHVLKLYKSVRR